MEVHRTARRRVIDWTGWCSDCARACGEGALATWCLLDHGLTLSWVVDVVGLVEMSARLSTHYWSWSGPQEFRDSERCSALALPWLLTRSSLAPSRMCKCNKARLSIPRRRSFCFYVDKQKRDRWLASRPALITTVIISTCLLASEFVLCNLYGSHVVVFVPGR